MIDDGEFECFDWKDSRVHDVTNFFNANSKVHLSENERDHSEAD